MASFPFLDLFAYAAGPLTGRGFWQGEEGQPPLLVVAGGLGQPPGHSENFVELAPWAYAATPFTMTVNFTLPTDPDGYVSLAFVVLGTEEFFFYITKYPDGTVHFDVPDQFQSIPLAPGSAHSVVVQYVAGELAVALDGVGILDITYNFLPPAGGTGLRLVADLTGTADPVRITRLELASP